MSEEYNFGESFQEKILALYIREPSLAFGVVEPMYFSNPIHMDVARLAKDIYEKHNRHETRLSKETMLAVVRGFLGKKRSEVWPGYRKTVKKIFIEEIDDKSVVMHQAVAFAKQQQFKKALIDAEKDVNGFRYERAIERFSKLKGFGLNNRDWVEYWKDHTDPSRWYEERAGLVRTFFFPTLDEMMGGGLGAGELGIFLAGGKVGKSTMLARVAAGDMFKSRNVAIATGELSAKKYRKRIDAMLTGTSMWKLSQLAHDDTFVSKKLARRLRRVQKRMDISRRQVKGRLYIRQYPTGKGRVDDVENWLEELEQEGIEIHLLIVDYVRVFRPNQRSESMRESIGQVCVDLRGLAGERKLPVWTASQTNRAALAKEIVGPEDMAEDISQFWTLDFLVALCQSKKEAEHKPYEKARLLLTAARDVGRGGIVEVQIDRETFRVWEKHSPRREKW